MLKDIIEVTTQLFDFVESFEKSDSEKRTKIAKYFSRISAGLKEVANQFNSGNIPYDKLAELRDLSAGLSSAIGEEIGKEKAVELSSLLSKCIGENLENNLESVRLIQEAAGKFDALAFRIEYSDSKVHFINPKALVSSLILFALMGLVFWSFSYFSPKPLPSPITESSGRSTPTFNSSSTSTKPSTQKHRTINQKGLHIIQSFEPLYLQATPDPVLGILVVGYSTTTGVIPGMRITKEQATELLKRDLSSIESELEKLIEVPVSDDQFSALVSFTFNVGIAALRRSTLLKSLNKGDYEAAANQFLSWQRANDEIISELSHRRLAERALFLGEKYEQYLEQSDR